MATRTLETDYLVVGCGAAGMAFTDALLDASPRADVIMVDRRHAPGGHWLERSRLNLMRGLPERAGDPAVQMSFARFLTNVRPALASLERLCAGPPAVG